MTYSIYPKKITEEPLGKRLYRFPKDKELATSDYKALAQLFLKNAQDMVESFQKKDLSRFDALTGNHACQSVAAAVVDCFSDKEVQKEVDCLKDSVKRLKQQCNETKVEAAIQEDGYMHFEDFFHKCCPALSVSKKVQFLCFAYLLNTASDNSKIPRQTDLSRLQPLSKRVSQEGREATVLGCRQEVAAYIARYIQEVATSLSDEQLLKNTQIIKEIVPGASSFSQGMGGIMTQATFFAFKAVLLKAKEEKTPIVLTQARNDKKPFSLVYQAQGREKPFALVQEANALEILRDRPCLVVEVQLPSSQDAATFLKNIRELQGEDPVMQLLLASGAISTQFAKVDGLEILPKEAALEVLYHRMVAEKIGCSEKNNSLAKVLHIAPGVICNRLDSVVQAAAAGLEQVAL